MQERKQVIITGHSTGGAVASLTALWLLSQPLPPSFHLRCITFGSPLLGNQSLSSSISRSRLAHNFCHVVSIHDVAPRRNDDLWPFGTFLFCSDNGGVCLDNAASVRGMFGILNSTGTSNIEERPRYEHYVSTLSHQFLVSRNFHNISDNSYQAGVALAVESLGSSSDHPSGVLAKECIETATTIGRAPILRSSELAIELGNVLPSRLQIQWFKDSCDASPTQRGYYDTFKIYSNKRELKVNMSRAKLAKYWDGVFEMVENNKLPFDFHLGKKWVYASQFYQLLAEPLDIAYFYKYIYSRTRGTGHYMESGNRPKRYVAFDKWWEEKGESTRETRAITRYASTTQDTCFWAKLEEAKEWLDELSCESSDAQNRSLLWEKIVGFESYADRLVKMKDVSSDVLARKSSYSVWVENLREFKSQMGNMVIDESDQRVHTSITIPMTEDVASGTDTTLWDQKLYLQNTRVIMAAIAGILATVVLSVGLNPPSIISTLPVKTIFQITFWIALVSSIEALLMLSVVTPTSFEMQARVFRYAHIAIEIAMICVIVAFGVTTLSMSPSVISCIVGGVIGLIGLVGFLYFTSTTVQHIVYYVT